MPPMLPHAKPDIENKYKDIVQLSRKCSISDKEALTYFFHIMMCEITEHSPVHFAFNRFLGHFIRKVGIPVVLDGEPNKEEEKKKTTQKVVFELHEMNCAGKAWNEIQDYCYEIKHTNLSTEQNQELVNKLFCEHRDDSIPKVVLTGDRYPYPNSTCDLLGSDVDDERIRKTISRVDTGAAPGMSGVGVKAIRFLMNT